MCSIFHHGKWVEVIVDDFLPVFDGAPAFLKSGTTNEFWAPLLEKAYAKLKGSYWNLSGGRATNALVDLTGGVAETYRLGAICNDALPPNFMTKFKKRLENEKVRNLACVVVWKGGDKIGLLESHAYTVIKVTNVKVGERSVDLVQLRNPWGNEFEWGGDWGDDSELWEQVSQEDKERIGYTKKADGEFFMEWATMVDRMSVLSEVRIFTFPY